MTPTLFHIIKIFLVIFLGLLSRKIPVCPAIVGDILRGVMMFYIVSFWNRKDNLTSAIIALSICISIEISQAIHIEFLDMLRSIKFAKLILGQGFLWSDILAYIIGVGITYIGENWYQKKSS